MQRLETLSFALAGAIYGAACVALATRAALGGFVEGFVHFGILAWLYNLVLERWRR